MDNVALEIILLLFLILLNGLLAMSEFAVVSARKSRLQPLADDGNERARAALDLAEHPDQFLATIQIGITLVGTLVGALGGATLAQHLAPGLAGIPLLVPYANAISFAVVVLLLTFLTLVFGELVPKQLALHSAERLALALAGPIRTLSKLTSPLVRFLAGSSNLIVRLLGVQPSVEPPVTEDEIKVLLEQGTQAGVFEEAEQEMVEGVFRMGGQRVGALMTPRPDIDWIDLDEPAGTIHDQILGSHRTRFPVAQGELDNVVGILHTKDLLAHGFQCEPPDIRKLLRPAVFIPESAEVLQALEHFKENRRTFRAGHRRIRQRGGRDQPDRHPRSDRRGSARQGRAGRTGSGAARGRNLADGRRAQHRGNDRYTRIEAICPRRRKARFRPWAGSSWSGWARFRTREIISTGAVSASK